MLVDLMSRCNILGAAASCKYSKPLAAPKATWARAAQLRGSLPCFASKHSRKFPFDMYSNTNSLSYFRLWYSQQYPIKGTTWQWLSLDIISICAQFKLDKTDYCCAFFQHRISKIIKMFITLIGIIEETVPSKEHERFQKLNTEAQACITKTDHDLRK